MSKQTRYLAALATIDTLDRFDARTVMSYADKVAENASKPQLSIVSRRKFRELVEVAVARLLERRGLPVEPYLAAFRVVAQ